MGFREPFGRLSPWICHNQALAPRRIISDDTRYGQLTTEALPVPVPNCSQRIIDAPLVLELRPAVVRSDFEPAMDAVSLGSLTSSPNATPERGVPKLVNANG